MPPCPFSSRCRQAHSVPCSLEGKGAATRVVPLDRLLPDLVGGSRPALLDAGILMLFATPLLGVLVAFVLFIRRRDPAFSLITALLLLVLGAGFLVALH
jgi:uncharacterized membrane protein